MAITFPLSTASFIELLRVQAIVPYLQFQQELSSQGSGGVIAKDMGPALWMADIQTASLKNHLLEELEAAIESLQGSIGTFYCYDTKRWYPKLDPGGSILGASTVKINSVPDNISLSLKGLPAGYVISRGDRFHFTYNTTSRAYHRALETVTANGSGVTAAFAVSPYLRTGAAADQDVTLIKPSAIMRLVPGSHTISPGILSSLQFKAQQVVI